MGQDSSKIPFLKTILCLIMVYLLGHVSPFLPVISNPTFSSLSLQTLAYAEEDEFDEEDEDEDEDEEDGDEEDGDEEGGDEEDLSYLTDIGPAAEHEFEEFSFLGFSNRKFTWVAAQLHILFASFILGCPMFVVIMEVMGARRTQAVSYTHLTLPTTPYV